MGYVSQTTVKKLSAMLNKQGHARYTLIQETTTTIQILYRVILEH